MLISVIVFNVLISLINLWLAWYIWKLRRTLSNLADTLSIFEENTEKILQITPEVVLKAQTGSNYARRVYAQWQEQQLKLKQVLTIVVFVSKILRGKLRDNLK